MATGRRITALLTLSIAGALLAGAPALANMLPDVVLDYNQLMAAFMQQDRGDGDWQARQVLPPPRRIHQGEPAFEVNLGIGGFWLTHRMADLGPLDAVLLGLAVTGFGGQAMGFCPYEVGAQVRYRFTPAVEGTLGLTPGGPSMGIRVAL